MSVHTCQCRCVPHVEDHCRNGEPDFPPCSCAPDCAERIACTKSGPGHIGCGWCDTHEQARHLCYCPKEGS